MLTHRAVERNVQRAIEEIRQEDFMASGVQLIRVDEA